MYCLSVSLDRICETVLFDQVYILFYFKNFWSLEATNYFVAYIRY